MELADKILRHRKQMGLSQEALSEKLNVSRQAVSRWETGTAQPDASTILQLSRLFGVSTDYLLQDDYQDDPFQPKEAKAAAEDTLKRILGICTAALGILGNLILYILSRFIKVMIPYPVYDNGEIIFYEYSSERTDYSYRYFVQEHNMEFLLLLLWGMFLAGMLYTCMKNDNIKKHMAKVISRTRKNTSV